MKAILILERIKDCDVEDYTCPLWNKDKLMCQYRFNTKSTGGCPLKPIPKKKEIQYPTTKGITTFIDLEYTLNEYLLNKGYNKCLDEIIGEEE